MKRRFTLNEIAEDVGLLSELLKMVRAGGGADHRFDLNLAEGKVSEAQVLSLLTGEETVEVKRDFKVSKTGNVALEFAHTGTPTGITTTEADWYAIALDGEEYNGEVVVFIKTDRLRRLVFNAPGRIIDGGDGHKSTFKALRIDRLLLDNTSIEDYEEYKRWQRKSGSRVKKLKSVA